MPLQANRCQQTHEGVFALEGTFRKVFVIFIVGPRVDPAGYGTMGEYWKNIRGSE